MPLPQTFTLHLKCPSVNSLYEVNYRLREISLKSIVKAFKYKVKTLTPRLDVPPDKELSLYIEYHSSGWYNKDGSIKNKDIQNIDKALIDAISEKIGIRDSGFFKVVRVKKVTSDKDKLVITIDRWTDGGHESVDSESETGST